MKLASTVVALAILLVTSVQAQTLSYPATRKVDQIDAYFGSVVPDPYRWLEDDNSADTKAWVVAQNEVTERYLSAMPQRVPVRKLYTELYNFERIGIPVQEGGRYFWTRNDGLQQQNVLVMARSLKEVPSVALDPNGLSKDGTVALAGWAPSRDGKRLAYSVARAGSDWETWRVRDLTTGRDLADEIQWVKFSRAAWTADGKGFFYSRYDAPKEGAALTGVNDFQKLYYHRLGTAQGADVLVAENANDKEWDFDAAVSDDGQWLVIRVRKSAGDVKSALMVLPLPKGAFAGGQPQPVTPLDFGAQYRPVTVMGGRLVIKTDKDAPRGRIVAIDLRNPAAAGWKTLVAEGPDAMIGASAVAGRLVLSYLKDASTVVRLHAADGKLIQDVALPGIGTAAGFAGRWSDRETFFSFTSLTTPTEIHRLDVKTGRVSLFKRPRTAFDADQFETRREFVTSKDGTRFPIFIAQRKGLKQDGSNPTLLWGYGGFNISMTPVFSVTAATWLKMGGVYVIASIRGGGEYGSAWHDAGTKLRKQNVFDDFIAAAEWLVANKVSSQPKLALNGGSNGGLLVGAVVNQRPDLFAAAVPSVGVMDMLRYQRFTVGWSWAEDYGTSDKPEEFAALAAYSPLHNVKSGVAYPAVLVTTGDHDDRVVPAHSFKYAATLQAAQTGSAPKLIRIETQAGHSAGKPTSKIIEERGDILAFIANAMKLEVR